MNRRAFVRSLAWMAGGAALAPYVEIASRLGMPGGFVHDSGWVVDVDTMTPWELFNEAVQTYGLPNSFTVDAMAIDPGTDIVLWDGTSRT